LAAECSCGLGGWRRGRGRVRRAFGEDDRVAAEAQSDVIVAGVDAGEGEAADRGGGLCVEEHEEAGDAVFDVDGLVAQQPTGLVPACFGVDDT